jgi:predicted nucleic acid-binding protein
MELVQGMRNKLELQALRTTIRSWGTRILPISESVSDRAVLYVEEHFLSSALRLADALIAATAVEYGLTLATGNTKHYRIVKELVTERFRP